MTDYVIPDPEPKEIDEKLSLSSCATSPRMQC